jgi:hypothetical protein
MSEARPTLTPDDDAAIRMLAGAHFHPDANIILPSGTKLSPDEMQALTSFYAPRNDDPPPSTYDHPAGDPATDRAALAARVAFIRATEATFRQALQNAEREVQARCDEFNGHAPERRTTKITKQFRVVWSWIRVVWSWIRDAWIWIRDAWILLLGGLR